MNQAYDHKTPRHLVGNHPERQSSLWCISVLPSFPSLRTSYGMECFQKFPQFLTCVTPFALWLWKSSYQEMELTPSPLEPELALWLTLQQKWQWADPSLSLKKSCTLLLTPGTPHLLWGQASGRQRQHGAKLSYPSWYHPRVANPYPTCLLNTNA